MSKEESKESFNVVDKRRFSEGGDVRDVAASQPEQKRPEPKQDQPKAAPNNQRPMEAPSVDFPSFVVSLATQAVVMLGEMPNPETGLVSMNLEAARQTIDILAMLQEKTKGNLSAEEQGLMQEVLTSLRLAYVNKTGSGKIAKP